MHTCTDAWAWCYVTRSSLVLAQTLDAALQGAGLPGRGDHHLGGSQGVAGLGDHTIGGRGVPDRRPGPYIRIMYGKIDTCGYSISIYSRIPNSLNVCLDSQTKNACFNLFCMIYGSVPSFRAASWASLRWKRSLLSSTAWNATVLGVRGEHWWAASNLCGLKCLDARVHLALQKYSKVPRISKNLLVLLPVFWN